MSPLAFQRECGRSDIKSENKGGKDLSEMRGRESRDCLASCMQMT